MVQTHVLIFRQCILRHMIVTCKCLLGECEPGRINPRGRHVHVKVETIPVAIYR